MLFFSVAVRPQACQVTIKGLQGFSQSDIEAIFEEAVGAPPLEVSVIDNPNRTRGLAFVKFDTPELARAVRHSPSRAVNRTYGCRRDGEREGTSGRGNILGDGESGIGLGSTQKGRGGNSS